jgi:hypothetical protein
LHEFSQIHFLSFGLSFLISQNRPIFSEIIWDAVERVLTDAAEPVPAKNWQGRFPHRPSRMETTKQRTRFLPFVNLCWMLDVGCWMLGIAPLSTRCYPDRVKTLSIKLDEPQWRWLEQAARAERRSKGSVVRLLIEEKASRGGTLKQALGDLSGCLSGSRNLSSRKLKGYGRD